VQPPSLLPLPIQGLRNKEDEGREAEGEREEAVVLVQREGEDVSREDEGDLEGEEGGWEGQRDHGWRWKASNDAWAKCGRSYVFVRGMYGWMVYNSGGETKRHFNLQVRFFLGEEGGDRSEGIGLRTYLSTYTHIINRPLLSLLSSLALQTPGASNDAQTRFKYPFRLHPCFDQ
jgi:hypothetical protein